MCVCVLSMGGLAGYMSLILFLRLCPCVAFSGSCIDSSWDCSRVDRVPVDFDRGRVVPGLIQLGTKF